MHRQGAPGGSPDMRCCAAGLPLFRAYTRGTSTAKGLAYAWAAGDEVEDLYRLVRCVKMRMPEVEAVCSGAIASDYQRLRVENVCGRLGLVSLAYMWRQPQSQLLEDMVASGIQAVLIKVAALGLMPERHLGKSLGEVMPHLKELSRRYGCNVCGEGGEYETLVLDAPAFKFGRIEIDKAWVLVEGGGGSIAPVGILNVQSFHLQPKEDAPENHLLGNVFVVPSDGDPPESVIPIKEAPHREDIRSDAVAVIADEMGQFIDLQISLTGEENESIDAELTQFCLLKQLQRLQDWLADARLSFADVVFVHLFLRDMNHFAAANKIYCQFFPSVNPPSRACVQLELQSACKVSVLIWRRENGSIIERSVLHVQSISAWAPCCIGPYSQATSVGDLTFMAGQLGLNPVTMQFDDLNWQQEACLATKHCQSVAIAVGADMKRSALTIVVYLAEAFVSKLADSERQTLQSIFESQWPAIAPSTSRSNGEDEGAAEDAYLKAPVLAFEFRPIVSFITVPSLPKAAAIEIQPILVNSRSTLQEGAASEDARARLNPEVFPDCCVSEIQEWHGHQLCLKVTMESDKYKVKPHARIINSGTGTRVFQICIPHLLEAVVSESVDLLANTCGRLTSCCLYVCGMTARNVLSATLWYNSSELDRQTCQAITKGIDAEMVHEDVKLIDWCCFPSKGIGSDCRLSDVLLLDCKTFRDYK